MHDRVVEVFRARPMHLEACAGLLDDRELARVQALRRPEDRARMATARTALRLVVADRLGRNPLDVSFDCRCTMCGRDHGKPVARTGDAVAPVHTSVSYSGSVVLVARAAVPIGVDVERCIATEFEGFAGAALSAEELDDLAAVAPRLRPGVQAALWTAKEAILKINAVGIGTIAPSAVHVGRRGRPAVVSVDETIASGGMVGVAAVPVDRGYRARVACEGDCVPTVVIRDLRVAAWADAGRTTTV